MEVSASYVRLLAAENPSEPFTDPAFWLNLGVAGVFLLAFFTGRLHSNREMDRVEAAHRAALEVNKATNDAAVAELRRQHEAAMKAHREAHESAMQRMDDHVRQLLVERDKANAERNEAVGVMRDFTLMAGAVLNQRPPWGEGLPNKGSGPR